MEDILPSELPVKQFTMDELVEIIFLGDPLPKNSFALVTDKDPAHTFEVILELTLCGLYAFLERLQLYDCTIADIRGENDSMVDRLNAHLEGVFFKLAIAQIPAEEVDKYQWHTLIRPNVFDREFRDLVRESSGGNSEYDKNYFLLRNSDFKGNDYYAVFSDRLREKYFKLWFTTTL